MSIDVTETTQNLSQRVAAQIRARMGYLQIRQSHLARTLGVTEQWLSVRLRGVQPIDLNDLDLIAAALNTAPAALLARSAGDTETSHRLTPLRPPRARSDRRPAGRPSGPSRPSAQRRTSLVA